MTLSPLPVLQQRDAGIYSRQWRNSILPPIALRKTAVPSKAILNTAAKNLPAYIKIVMGHLEQLVSLENLTIRQPSKSAA